MQVDTQELLNATTVKVKDIWLGNALSLSDQGMQHDLGVSHGQAIQKIIPNNDAFQTKDLDTYDFDCDDISNAKAILIANISNYGSDVISEVPHSETYLNDMKNQGFAVPFFSPGDDLIACLNKAMAFLTTVASSRVLERERDNRPPMLEKSLYNSSKSCMELYMKNRENEGLILDSIIHGLLVWPTVVQEDGTTRKKMYKELQATEKIQADCDLKATNIVLQSLPPDVYDIVNHHKVAKETWDKIKLLMQGTKLSL
nr:hypothetical protein [Tanacetum cinerariifolium]